MSLAAKISSLFKLNVYFQWKLAISLKELKVSRLERKFNCPLGNKLLGLVSSLLA